MAVFNQRVAHWLLNCLYITYNPNKIANSHQRLLHLCSTHFTCTTENWTSRISKIGKIQKSFLYKLCVLGSFDEKTKKTQILKRKTRFWRVACTHFNHVLHRPSNYSRVRRKILHHLFFMYFIVLLTIVVGDKKAANVLKMIQQNIVIIMSA